MTAHFQPSTEAEISACVCEAAQASTSLTIRGGGTRSARVGREHLDISSHSGVTLYEPGALTLVAKSGTPMAEIEAALESEGQMLAFEPMDYRPLLGTNGNPTIGGVVACNASGPRRFLAGACRDHLLGVRFVDGQGRVLKSGGRVMKNVTGFDLVKLMCGAHGTLGVLTEVSLKVLPRPERAVTLRFDGLDAAQSAALFCRAVGTPFEVSGAAWIDGAALLRVEGLSPQVDYRVARLQNLFSDHAAEVVDGEAHNVLWARVRDLQAFAGTDAAVWKLSLRATDAGEVATHLNQQFGAQITLDQAGAVVWAGIDGVVRGQANAIREMVAAKGGYATLMRRGAGQEVTIPKFHPEHPRLAAVSAALRRQFDPSQILNPGLMAA